MQTQILVWGNKAAMGNNISGWVIQEWVFLLPEAYQSVPDLYLSLIAFLSLPAAALVEVCQDLFPALSWFSFGPFVSLLPAHQGLHLKASAPSWCNPLSCTTGTNVLATPVSMDSSAGVKVSAAPLQPLPKGLVPPVGHRCPPLLQVLPYTQRPLNLCNQSANSYW